MDHEWYVIMWCIYMWNECSVVVYKICDEASFKYNSFAFQLEKAILCPWCDDLCTRSRAPSQYPKRRLFVRSRKVSKPRDWYFKLSYRFEIWRAHRQHCCRSACQISERSDDSKYKCRGFETLRDLTERRLFGYWDGALVSREKTSNCIPRYLWDVINCSCPWYVLLAQKSSSMAIQNPRYNKTRLSDRLNIFW